MKSRCPGASNKVKDLVVVENCLSATSIVTPCSRSDSLSSVSHDRGCEIFFAVEVVPAFVNIFPINVLLPASSHDITFNNKIMKSNK